MRKPAVAAALVLALLSAAGAHGAGPPPVQRPNPVLTEPKVDYVTPIVDAQGKPTVLAPLRPAVIAAAVSDEARLRYRDSDDLGGFVPAPVGVAATDGGGGRTITGRPQPAAEIPHFADAAGGETRSFAWTGDLPVTGATVDNGEQPVPGLGTPPSTPTPTNTNTVPPPNQGFGGVPTTTTTGTTTTTRTATEPSTTTTTTRPPPTTTTRPPTTTTRPTTTTTTTTTPTTTTAPTTTATTTTTPTTTAGPPPTTTSASPGGASCGTAGLSITSDHDSCRIYAVNMAPGSAASEVLTIRNDSGERFVLSLRARGTRNRLWQELTLGVWEVGTAAPTPLPPLLWWTPQANQLATLGPGETIRYNVALYLPTSAGNDVQNMTAVIDLEWTARGV